MNNFKIFETKDHMNRYAIDILKDISSKKKGSSIAFSGGKTPIDFFRALSSQDDINWKNIYIFLVDERYVPLDHKDSNYNSLKTNLLDKINIPKENIYNIPYLDTIDKSKKVYTKNLMRFFNNNIQFDLVFLGVGSDGHTASIFEVEETKLKDPVIITSSSRHPHHRISLGMEVINNSKNKVVLLGPEKHEIILKKNKALPIFYVEDPLFISYK
jgi:6-phosphogluconolactonase